jgi:signal transduction histidine kinase
VADPRDLWGDLSRPRPRRLLFDVVVAGLFTGFGLLVVYRQGGLLVAATVAMGLALAVRRLSWRAMVALAVVVGALQLAAGELAVFADLGFAPVCFVLGAHPWSWVRRLGLAGAVLAAVVVATAVGAGALGQAPDGGSSLFAVIASGALAMLVAGGGWAAGYARWQGRARVLAQVQAGLEEERTRIATDMHDLVAHTWAVVAAQADGARYALDSGGAEPKVREALEVIAETARGSIAELRDLLAELRYEQPATPHERTSRTALVERLRASGMELRTTSYGAAPTAGRLAPVSERVLAEALTNALKHGDLGHPVEVEEDWRHGYGLVVRNRVGPSSGAVGTGHGIAGMRDRVAASGGSFDAGRDGDAWVVKVSLPEPAP